MALDNIRCRLLFRLSSQASEPQAIDMAAIQEMPTDLREKWAEAIIAKANGTREEQNEEGVSFQTYLLTLDGSVETLDSPEASDIEGLPVHYDSMTDVIAALASDATDTNLSSRASTSSDNSYSFDNPESLRLLNRAMFTDNMAGIGALSGTLIFTSLKSLAKLQENIRRLSPALLKRLKDLSAWIRAHPYQTAGIVGGVILFSLACATPAILAAAGFSSIGPVAGSAAAAWQASMGSVAAGSLFAFLQSAAMGGAAMGLFVGIGGLGGGVAVAAGLAASTETKEKIGDFIERVVVGRVAPVVENVKNFVEKEIVGGVVARFKGFFSKDKHGE